MTLRRSRRAVLVALVGGVAALFLGAPPALGSIEDQRERLPPPEDCADPVEGVWMSKRYFELRGDWYVFTLEVHRSRTEKTALTGEIVSHFWAGSASNVEPPVCGAGAHEAFIKMPASGTVESTPAGDRVVFGAKTFTIDRVVCGVDFINYLPDNFSGTIDKARQEFQSVNNDGGSSVNEPHVFRRIQCLEPPPAPASSEPPKPPPRASRGCSCGF